MVPTRLPRKIFMAVAVRSGPREPIMLPKQTTKPVNIQMFGYHCSSQSRKIPAIDSA